jgi:hypothetical protein
LSTGFVFRGGPETPYLAYGKGFHELNHALKNFGFQTGAARYIAAALEQNSEPSTWNPE